MEEWKPVKECPVYEVSNKGRVRRAGRILRPGKNTRGYIHVTTCYMGVKTTRDVHRLVAEAFIDNPDRLSEIDHIDRDPSNNSVENLRWCTRSDNNLNKEPKPGKLGVSNIWDDNGRYRVCFRNAKKQVTKNFDTLEAAIAFRNEVLA